MSDTESIYARTEYQATEYGDSDYGDDDERPGEEQHTADDGDTGSADVHSGGSDEQASHIGAAQDGIADADSSHHPLTHEAVNTDGYVTEDDGGNEPDAEEADGEVPDQKVSAFPQEVLDILRDNWGQWKAAGRKERKAIWKTIGDELKELDVHKDIDVVEWRARLRLYNHWMRRRKQGQENRKAIRLGQKWTARSVVRETHKEQLRDIIADHFGRPRDQANIECWQPALTLLMSNLSEEELEAAEETATEWNTRGAPADAQHRFATRGAYKVMKGFAEEMWKRGGLRLIILSGFKDEKGALFSQVYDFNKNIAEGPAFVTMDAVLDPFEEFLKKCFPVPKTEDEENGEGDAEQKTIRKARASTNKDALIAKITAEDGTIWIPDISDATRTEKQALVRAFLTSHYRDVCPNEKASAPFKQLPKFQDQLFKREHLPPKFLFPDDPSHMTTKDTTRFLNFIRGRQETHRGDVFEFQFWLKDKTLMPPLNLDGNVDTGAEEAIAGGGDKTADITDHEVDQKTDLPTQQCDEAKDVGDACRDDSQSQPQRDVAGSSTVSAVAANNQTPSDSGAAAAGHSKPAAAKPLVALKKIPKVVDGSALRSEGGSGHAGTPGGDASGSAVGVNEHLRSLSPQEKQSRASEKGKPTPPRQSASKGKQRVISGTTDDPPSADESSARCPENTRTTEDNVKAPKGITLSFRPSSKSIVQQEKERLNVSTLKKPSSQTPNSGILRREPTPGPSKPPKVKAIRKGMPEFVEKQDDNVSDASDSVHDAYKELPVVPLRESDSRRKVAEPSHHRTGPPLKSAMKVSTSQQVGTAGAAPTTVIVGGAERNQNRPNKADSIVPMVIPHAAESGQVPGKKKTVKKMPVSASTPDDNECQIDLSSARIAGPTQTDRAEMMQTDPASKEVKHGDRSSDRPGNKDAHMKKTRQIEGGSKKVKDSRTVNRIQRTSSTPDGGNVLNAPPDTSDTEEPVTPPMKQKTAARFVDAKSNSMDEDVNRPSGSRAGYPAHTAGNGVADGTPTKAAPGNAVSMLPETPRRSGRSRRRPPPPDVDFEEMHPKAKKRRRGQ